MASSSPSDEQYLDPEGVAQFLNVPKGTVYRWSSQGGGPPVLKVGRHLRYPRSKLLAWLEQQAK